MRFIGLHSLILVTIISCTFSCRRVQRAYEALEQYNYFEAKRLFEKKLENRPIASGYGLSIIYERGDNPFTNLDSAYKYIMLANREYDSLDGGSARIRDLERWGITETSLFIQKQKIYEYYYAQSIVTSQVKPIQDFIDQFYDYQYIDRAIALRDSLAYAWVLQEASTKAYTYFYKKFPHSKQAKEAKLKAERSFYKEKTAKGTAKSYLDFIRLYPEHSYVEEAGHRLYEVSILKGRLREFISFVRNFPANSSTSKAWEAIYSLWFTDFNSGELQRFRKKFPDFPNQQRLQSDLYFASQRYYPVYLDGQYGFINDSGRIVISAVYDFVHPFSDELALVSKDEKIGYIDKRGLLVLDFQFDEAEDFYNGFAVVDKGERVGLIDKRGTVRIPLDYDQITRVGKSEFLAYKDGFYQYLDRYGVPLFKEKFEKAEVFQDARALVKRKSKYGVINRKGREVVPIIYDAISRIGGGLLKVKRDGKWGILTAKSNKQMAKIQYDEIGRLQENRIIFRKAKKYGFLNAKAKVVIPAKYTVFEDFLDRAVFKNGLSLVHYKGREGLITKTGKLFFSRLFKEIGPEHVLPIACRVKKKWGFVDKEVKLQIPYQFDESSFFHHGLAVVSYKGKYGLINLKGKREIPYQYEHMEWFLGKEFLLITKNGKRGIIDKKDNFIIPANYIRIEKPDENQLVRLFLEDGRIHYFHWDTKLFLYKD